MIKIIVYFILAFFVLGEILPQNKTEIKSEISEEMDMPEMALEKGGAKMDKQIVDMIIKESGRDEDFADYICDKISKYIPDTDFKVVEKYSDDIGNGIRILTEDGVAYIIYYYNSGAVFGIKNEANGEYLYAVYE